jgi:hypothetical protein
MNMFATCESIEEIVGQAIGAASVCWENPAGAGRFDSVQASEICEDAIYEIRRRAFL